jgi:hypothetical protein
MVEPARIRFYCAIAVVVGAGRRHAVHIGRNRAASANRFSDEIDVLGVKPEP